MQETQETQVQSLGREDPLEEGMATHSSVLAWSGSGRSLGGGHGNPLQCSCLENPVDRGAWRATVHMGRKESDTAEGAHPHTQSQISVLPLKSEAVVRLAACDGGAGTISLGKIGRAHV